MKSSFFKSIPAIIVAMLAVSSIVYAGSLTAPSGTPSATSYTLDDIYRKLNTNTNATITNHSLSTTTSPAASFYTLTQIYNAIPTIYSGDFLASSTYLGVTGGITVKTGNTSVASSSIQGTSFVLTVPQGYYSGAASVTVSTSSTNMFLNQKNQTKDDWVNSAGTTGEYTAEESTWDTVSGSPFSGYNSINYSAAGATWQLVSGTVKQDQRTGLWWSDAAATTTAGGVGLTASTTSNVFGNATDGTRPTGGNAIGFCDALNSANFGGYNDWYLPTQKQLMQAYIDGSANNLPSPGFTFWSSTEYYNTTAYAWNVALYNVYSTINTKVTSSYVRCVR